MIFVYAIIQIEYYKGKVYSSIFILQWINTQDWVVYKKKRDLIYSQFHMAGARLTWQQERERVQGNCPL